MASVFRYIRDWEEMTSRIGHWVDLDHAYVTYRRSYVESVWWALAELQRKGLLYRGEKVVWWWAQGGTALSSAEVGLGYREVDDPAVYVTLPLVDDPGLSLVVWTTTPWTLPSNLYSAVRPGTDYVEVEDTPPGGEPRRLVLAAALREDLAGRLGRPLRVLRTFAGEELVGRRYRPPFDDFWNRHHALEGRLPGGGSVPAFWRVLAADFVELDQGTGLVHEAPAFGEVDHDLHKKTVAAYENADEIPLPCAVGVDGCFTAEVPWLAGQWVKHADKEIVRRLRESGRLIHSETIRHEYPFCWRSDQDPLIQYARPAWFIRTTAKKDAALANSGAVNWLPEHIKEGRFGDFLRNNVDWALSRERFWGTPLNIWINDETGRMEAPASVAEIEAKNPGRLRRLPRSAERTTRTRPRPHGAQALGGRGDLDPPGRARRLPPGPRGHRLLVRLRGHALRAVGIPAPKPRPVPQILPRRLHHRGGGPDPRLVLLAADDLDPALRRGNLRPARDSGAGGAPPLPLLPGARPRHRPRGPEGVQVARQLHPAGRGRSPRPGRTPSAGSSSPPRRPGPTSGTRSRTCAPPPASSR